MNLKFFGGVELDNLVTSHKDVISKETRQTISYRYHVITKAINKTFWNSEDDTKHSMYVGSYGRSTAIKTGDIDILVELPRSMYKTFRMNKGNVQSQFLQVVRKAIIQSYPHSKIRADGQVIKINFSDGMRFEILPAFSKNDLLTTIGFDYADSNMGGNWKSTNPKAEQKATSEKNKSSNGLYNATCRHMRYIRDTYFSSYHLAGIVIDSFVYTAMENWQYVSNDNGSSHSSPGDYEQKLLDYLNENAFENNLILYSPGSNQFVDTNDSFECLKKVLYKMLA